MDAEELICPTTIDSLLKGLSKFKKMINLFDNQSIEFKASFYLFHLFENRKQTRNHRNKARKGRTHNNPENIIAISYESFDKVIDDITHCHKFGFFAPRTNRTYTKEVDFNDLIPV